MPNGAVLLKPGVDVEMTPALNEAGISQSQLIRSKNGLTQTVGGWAQYGIVTVPSTVKSLHAWQDVSATAYLSAAATANIAVMTATSYKDVMPRMRSQSTAAPNLSISSGSQVVTVVAYNAGVAEIDSVEFVTPVSIGNLNFIGSYPVNSILSTGSFTFISSVVSSTTIASSGVTPLFTTSSNGQVVTVTESNNTVAAITGLQPTYLVPTSVGGLTIEGPYNVFAVADSTNYLITSPISASSSGSVRMNSGNAYYRFWTTTAAINSPTGYGSGGYGLGGYGIGFSPSGSPGDPITVTDWTQDNWGEILLVIEKDGPVFEWSPSNNYGSAKIVDTAPLMNGGGFVSMPQQILVLWKSVQTAGNGGLGNTQDPLIVRWSDAQDYTNYTVSEQTAAGSFHIPTGSVIRGGLQAPQYGVIWTDVDVWIMQYTNDPVTVFNFTRTGSGCGLIGPHAAGVIAGDVVWCGEANIYVLTGGGVQVIPCTVWDFLFQNINRDYAHKVVLAPNSAYNEFSIHFPSGAATENDAYIKYNIADKTSDYGYLSRTAWRDVSVIGMPVGTDTGSIVYQHESGNMITGAGNSYFRTGWWAINEGHEMAFVDWIMPDFIWGTYGTSDATVNLRFFSADYPGDTPTVHGPYTVSQTNQYISPRIRGRLLSMEVTSATNNVFWRLGRVRYRWAPSGAR